MIGRSAWIKPLRDALSHGGWRRLPGETESWESVGGLWRLKIETLGKYPGYGWRVWRSLEYYSRRSFFFAGVDGVMGWLKTRGKA